ncbi:hypothetical protein B0H15DRAFT_806249 [Mycena belliarum]|uniref:Uncharacterized protein n=1 Tax=Mycena belliarum TaxID=1033014 RepID=A0AAD6TQC3_9AGAR|nr:hypothetical protein B0H15DRAFT_806249 [Mycena belliae]
MAHKTGPLTLKESTLALFDSNLATKQRHSKELVLFCLTLRLVAKTAWPVVNSFKVPANHMCAYLQSKAIYRPCFCTMNNPLFDMVPLSSRIVTWPTYRTFAFCHYQSARCQFFYLNIVVPLDDLYQTSTLVAPYIPIVGEKDLILSRFLLTKSPSLKMEPLSEATFVPGFLGETAVVPQLGSITLGDGEDILYFRNLSKSMYHPFRQDDYENLLRGGHRNNQI